MLGKALVLTSLVVANIVHVAQANEQQPQGFFVGARAEASTIDVQDDDSNQAAGVELNLGYMFNRYFGLSAGYGKSFNLLEDTQGYGDDFERAEAFVIGRYPLSDYAGINLGLGGAYSESETSPVAQIFIDYKLADAWYLNAGYKYFVEPMDQDEDISAFQVGAQYFFGVEPQKKVKPAPQPVVAPPPLAPKPAEEPKYQPLPQQELMVHFKFDSTQVVKTSALDNLVKQIKQFIKHSDENQRDYGIVIEGYADPQGPAEYNFKLSKRRAEFLQNYLIKKGIEPSKIELVVGRGEIEAQTNSESRRVVVTYTEE